MLNAMVNMVQEYFLKSVVDSLGANTELGNRRVLARLGEEGDECGRIEHPLFGDRDELPDPCAEATRIPALDVHDTRSTKSADEPFSRREASDPT